MKNTVKALIYVVLGSIVAFASIMAIISMFFSGTFLPVYIGSKFVWGNRIVRYALYILLFIVAIGATLIANYGAKYLSRRKKHSRY